ncbi:MAG: nitroreductase family protein [Spirochaetota bacterium]
MTFLELARRRFSARHFKDVQVEKEKLLQVLEAGRIAPSAANRQPWHFVVVQDEQMRRDIATAYHKPWILEAPVIIVICGDHNLSWRRPDGKDHLDIDIGIAVDHMTLAAAELGLGTCWVCMFNSMLCHEILKLPPNIETVVLLPLGYPVDEPDVNRHQTKRKPLEEIVHWDKF